MSQSEYVMLATIGGQPQVVTFALDELLSRGAAIREVIVIHLNPSTDRERTEKALHKLAEAFAGDRYAGRPCRLRTFPLNQDGERLDDIQDEGMADAARSAIYPLITGLKAQGRSLHVCISGGRRMLALLVLSAALLHFDHHDRLWHMYTPPDFLEQARDGAIMHARPEDGVRLIQVPLVPWGAYFPALRTLGGSAPAAPAPAPRQDPAERARCRQVIDPLTGRQAETLEAFAAGKNPQQVADALSVTIKTVHAHKTAILALCRNAWDLPEGARLSYHFLREKFGPFFETTGL